jgi:hypothetical protein
MMVMMMVVMMVMMSRLDAISAQHAFTAASRLAHASHERRYDCVAVNASDSSAAMVQRLVAQGAYVSLAPCQTDLQLPEK